MKIRATERIHKVTRAMEAVSAVKMRKTQASEVAGRPYVMASLSILARLTGTTEFAHHPLTDLREVKKLAVVIITSDKGLAGSINSGVIKMAVEAIKERGANGSVDLYVVGKKGQEYFARRNYTIKEFFDNSYDEAPRSVVKKLSKDFITAFADGVYDEVLAVYNHFKSTIQHVPIVHRLLPLSLEAVENLAENIVPDIAKWKEESITSVPIAYEMESSYDDIFCALAPRLLAVSLYHLLLESKAVEHSARMIAMKNASDKSKDIIHALTSKYNKARQAAITREVSEIVGGREALETSV